MELGWSWIATAGASASTNASSAAEEHPDRSPECAPSGCRGAATADRAASSTRTPRTSRRPRPTATRGPSTSGATPTPIPPGAAAAATTAAKESSTLPPSRPRAGTPLGFATSSSRAAAAGRRRLPLPALSWSLSPTDGFSFLTVLQGHTKAITGVAIPGGGDKLYSSSKDGSVRVWDCQTGKCVADFGLGQEVGCLVGEGSWVFVRIPNALKMDYLVDRSWMYEVNHIISSHFKEGLESFLGFAAMNATVVHADLILVRKLQTLNYQLNLLLCLLYYLHSFLTRVLISLFNYLVSPSLQLLSWVNVREDGYNHVNVDLTS